MSNKSKFKVGDRVRCVAKVNSILPSGNVTIGELGTVVVIFSDNIGVYWDVYKEGRHTLNQFNFIDYAPRGHGWWVYRNEIAHEDPVNDEDKSYGVRYEFEN